MAVSPVSRRFQRLPPLVSGALSPDAGCAAYRSTVMQQSASRLHTAACNTHEAAASIFSLTNQEGGSSAHARSGRTSWLLHSCRPKGLCSHPCACAAGSAMSTAAIGSDRAMAWFHVCRALISIQPLLYAGPSPAADLSGSMCSSSCMRCSQLQLCNVSKRLDAGNICSSLAWSLRRGCRIWVGSCSLRSGHRTTQRSESATVWPSTTPHCPECHMSTIN